MPTISVKFQTLDGFECTISDRTELYDNEDGEATISPVELALYHVQQVVAAGLKPAAAAVSAGARSSGGADGYPANLPQELQRHWDKLIPVGKFKGEKLGPHRKDWEWFLKEGRFEDMKAAARALTAWDLGL